MIIPVLYVFYFLQVYAVCCAPDEIDHEAEEAAEAAAEAAEEQEEDETIGNFPLDPAVNRQCGYRNFNNEFRIINGKVASINEFPFMVFYLIL